MQHPRGGFTYTTASCNLSIAWLKELHHYTTHQKMFPLAINNSCSHLGPAAMPNPLGNPLPTHALVCTTCTVKWFMEFTEVYRGVYRGEVSMLLEPAELKPASQMITTLLKGIMVHS